MKSDTCKNMFCVYVSKLSGLKFPLAFAKLCSGGIPFYVGEGDVCLLIFKNHKEAQVFIMSQHI